MREIKIFAQGNYTFASLVNSREVLKFETARYNPNDAKQGLPYSFEIGAKLALDRLFDKMKETERQAKVGEWIKFTWWEYSGSVELVDKVGKVLDIDEFIIKIEHEKAWTNSRESKKGFEITKFYKSNIKYVVLEGYRGK